MTSKTSSADATSNPIGRHGAGGLSMNGSPTCHGGWTEIPMSVARFEELDRDLAAAGLPSTYSLKRLMDEDPQIPLRPAPGMKIGYAGTRQILATWVELSEVIGTVPIARRSEVNAVLKFLSSYPGWNHLAVDLGRPAPGLLVVWQPDTVEDAHPTGLRAGRTAS